MKQQFDIWTTPVSLHIKIAKDKNLKCFYPKPYFPFIITLFSGFLTKNSFEIPKKLFLSTLVMWYESHDGGFFQNCSFVFQFLDFNFDFNNLHYLKERKVIRQGLRRIWICKLWYILRRPSEELPFLAVNIDELGWPNEWLTAAKRQVNCFPSSSKNRLQRRMCLLHVSINVIHYTWVWRSKINHLGFLDVHLNSGSRWSSQYRIDDCGFGLVNRRLAFTQYLHNIMTCFPRWVYSKSITTWIWKIFAWPSVIR